jgi:hypothetical protein
MHDLDRLPFHYVMGLHRMLLKQAEEEAKAQKDQT